MNASNTSIAMSRRELLTGFAAGAVGLSAVTIPFAGPLAGNRAFAGTKGGATTDEGFVAQPVIDNCAVWEARQPRRNSSVLQAGPNKIIVHHTVGENTDDFSRAQAHAHARWVQDLHMDDNGWFDTGYHLTNSRGGWLTEGRHGSLFALLRNNGNTMVQGAHTAGQNSEAIGIANEGAYHDGAEPPDRQWDGLVEICAFVCQQYQVPAEEIYGHQDFGDTLCPGVIQDRLPELRAEVAQRLA